MKSVLYTALAIANNFVEQFGRDDGIEHMKLQKLVYCSYGWWLAAKGLEDERLTLERPEVWRYGPVFAGLYSALRNFGRRPIREPKSMHPFRPHPNVGPMIRNLGSSSPGSGSGTATYPDSRSRN